MVMHCAAFLEAGVAAVTNSQINALLDNELSIRNNNFFLNKPYDLVWAAAIGAVMEEARLTSPNLRVITTPQLRPITIGAVVAAEPRIADYRARPFRLPMGEEISAQATVGAVGGTQVIVLGLGFQLAPAPQGDVYTLRGVSTTPAVANTWTNVSPLLVWDDQLPNGRYHIIGMTVVAAGMYAARLVIPGEVHRPGCIGQAALGDNVWPGFLKGGLGILGTFSNDIMPGLEVLENAATADHTVFLDLIPAGPRGM